jgi:hypothetical protein
MRTPEQIIGNDALLGRWTDDDAKMWCKKYGFEFLSWDGTFCSYRDSRHAGTTLEFGLESWITK